MDTIYLVLNLIFISANWTWNHIIKKNKQTKPREKSNNLEQNQNKSFVSLLLSKKPSDFISCSDLTYMFHNFDSHYCNIIKHARLGKKYIGQ